MKILLSMMLCVVTLYSNPVNNQGLVKEVMVGEVQIEETKKDRRSVGTSPCCYDYRKWKGCVL